jgi:hypothetical protein
MEDLQEVVRGSTEGGIRFSVRNCARKLGAILAYAQTRIVQMGFLETKSSVSEKREHAPEFNRGSKHFALICRAIA